MQQTDSAALAHSADGPEALMVGYQGGHAPAATALVRAVSPMLLRLFVADMASRAHADDLLQETWLRIHRVRHTYRPGEPVLPWFYAIARSVRIDHYRRTRRTTGREASLGDMSDVAATGGGSTPLDVLDALLVPLSPGEREVIEMLKVVGMSLKEVARATSCSVGSVKQKVHRAYEKLRKRKRQMRAGNLHR